MYISKIRLWNFRKFGNNTAIDLKLDKPDLSVTLKQGLNALVGPNDSGKTAIVDSIKIILGIQSTEWNWLGEDDFYGKTNHLRIECDIEGFSIPEGKNFTEWSEFNSDGEQALMIRLNAHKSIAGVTGDIKAGAEEGTILPGAARSMLKAVYLKPLRDAQNELLARKGSRLSQILKGHTLFSDEGAVGSVKLKGHINTANIGIRGYFQDLTEDGYQQITKILEGPLKDFFDTSTKGIIDAGDTHAIKPVLEKLSLRIENLKNPGLGSLNRLFIAIELLLFLSNFNNDGSAHILLIEELEAHLHPQAQLKIAKYLQDKSSNGDSQIIITTHSPVLASKIELDNLIIFTESLTGGLQSFSLSSGLTMLKDVDYRFLERFLDSTKANLFFAKGVLIVEGDAENILLPSIASKLRRDLTSNGVSIVNVGSTAYMRYVNIFNRIDGSSIPILVSAITDLDIKPEEYKVIDKSANTEKNYTEIELAEKHDKKIKFDETDFLKGFVSPHWTLEYCIALSSQLREMLYRAILLSEDEKKLDSNSNYKVRTDAETTNLIDEYFRPNGVESQKSIEEIAFDLYYNKIKKPELSKAMVAQHLANLIEDSELVIDETDPSLKYLYDSIKHVTTPEDL